MFINGSATEKIERPVTKKVTAQETPQFHSEMELSAYNAAIELRLEVKVAPVISYSFL